MKYLSVCSGIEAATVAWHGLDWTPVGFSEIEPFPSAVLQYRYPSVPNLGDMTNYKEWQIEHPDLLVGGTPCQSFSVAGLRKGLDDPRGNLALIYCGILDYFRPQWFVWENVPGVLSSGGGRDFGSFLGAVAQLGYGFAYRVLDAQWFGVAQRRRRVFVVGYLGDWRPAAAVLFEHQSLRRDTAPSREKGEETSRCLTTGTSQRYDAESETMIPVGAPEVMCTLRATGAGFDRPGNAATEHETYIPMAQPVSIQGNLIGREAGGPQGVGASDSGVMYTLTKADVHGVAQPVAFGGEVAGTLDANYYKGQGSANYGEREFIAQPVAPTLTASNDPSRSPQSSEVTKQVAAVHSVSMAVRRLTPVECERLQGFPDNYTEIPWRGKTETPDGPRYKALGNSMAVPVMRWIGEGIDDVNSLG